MGFYIRKSFSFGPFRFNLSKRGIGTSVGVKGLRVSSGPRGTELYAGRYGVYYRQKLDGPPESNGVVPPVQTASNDDMPPIQQASVDADIPPVQNISNSSLGFVLVVLAILVGGLLALAYLFG